jgi:type IV secretory pathway VirB10-like protein
MEMRGAAGVRGRTIGIVDIDVADEQDRVVAIGRGSQGIQPG